MRDFEEQLTRGGLADRSRLFQIALESIDEPGTSSLVGKPLVLFDVPLHTQLERAFITGLIDRASDAFATVPTGDKQTMDCLPGVRGAQRTVLVATGTHSLARLQNTIFRDSAAPAQPDGRVNFFSAPGESRECVEIARFLLEEAKAGTVFDRMAVFLRSPQTYCDLLETALNRAGIPSYFARDTARPDPSGRAFLAILSCATEDLSARRFAEYLSFGQVPEVDEEGGPPRDRGIWSPSQDETVMSISEPRDDVSEKEETTALDSDAEATLHGSLRAPRKWEELLVESAVIGRQTALGAATQWARVGAAHKTGGTP